MDLKSAIRKSRGNYSSMSKKKNYKVWGGKGCEDKELMIVSLVTLNDSVWPQRWSEP